MRALIVESSVLDRLKTRDALTTRGFTEIDIARSPGEALIHVRASSPDVVIVGHHLQKRDVNGTMIAKLTAAGADCLAFDAGADASAPDGDAINRIADSAKARARERQLSRADRLR